ncbi:hypothetical protein EKG38_24465 [Shewanella canadensis]|uniref:DUF2384 domain-containing protein n=1 Tax=Shewanella canadensis TaxID=271096 RepID=A0A3S0II42_9GAMM|nr:hypothetical protein [Shewanella canadensis]RTR35899.1 hypothetical protein EKG38_24465 [Shewanella canadensis]
MKFDNDVSPEAVQIRFKTVLTILEKWGCNKIQVKELLSLGNDVGSINTDAMPLTRAQILRLSYILNIHNGLRGFFSNAENLYGYMTMVNDRVLFSGATPLEVLLNGTNEDFDAVMHHVEHLSVH